jgi:predicted RNA-binding protein YlqC (UPF0109 family)
MKQTLEFIVKGIVEMPEKVAIEEEEVDGILEFTLFVDPLDVGKVIGKEGKVIRAIRNVLKIMAVKEGKKIFVRIKDQQ